MGDAQAAGEQAVGELQRLKPHVVALRLLEPLEARLGRALETLELQAYGRVGRVGRVYLDLLIALRCLQGVSGGVLLIAGQALLFLAFPRSRQPLLQALFAMGSVVAPPASVHTIASTR